MRYVMIAMLSAFLLSPLLGCDMNKKEETKRNPITGSTTHTESRDMN